MGSGQPALRRAMGLRDVVLFLVVSVVGPRWIAVAAAAGPSSLAIWLIGAAVVFLPAGFAVHELAARHPEEGGIYVWIRRSFGERIGFLAGFLYWASNLLYFPGLLYFAAGNALYAGGPRWQALSASPPYFIAVTLAGLCVALLINLVGLPVGKWLHNAGALGTWLPVAALIILAGVVVLRFGPATSFSGRALLPSLSLRDLLFCSTIAYGFSGLESASLMGGEVVDARRTIPRAILLAGAIIAGIYLLGTAAILIALPQAEVSGLSGLMQAIARTAERAGVPAITRVCAVLLALGSIGGVGAWLSAMARLPFVAGLDRHLPPAFSKLHPRWGTPHVALLAQAAGAALFAVLGQAGTTVQGAYDVLVSMAVITAFVPYLFMFAALIKVQREPLAAGAAHIPGGKPVATLVAVVGIASTLGSIVLAVLPPPGSENPLLAVAKIVLLSMALVLAGVLLYASGARRREGEIE